ncbi:RNA polymerase sigma-70 factor [Rubrolithibacter danxiaensis]|uniref:RNA polymerase sigma-70 factor n=1 Tax=Rubrolithibacter danxiaensis TaxID=3390805 RepID=UPI003BF901B7
MPTSFCSDADLWKAIRRDDEQAFNTLFERYWVRLYKTAYQYLKDAESSEEIVHDVFLSIWNRRHLLEIESFPNFLLTSVRYQIYNRMRSAKLSIVSTSDYADVASASTENKGNERIMYKELQQELHHYLNQLPKRCREIFELSRIEHLSNEEIALRLGISKRTVENQITVALKHLRVCLKHIASIATLIIFFK